MIMEEFKIYSAGRFIETDRKHEVVNPFTGKSFAITYLADTGHLETAIKKAKDLEDVMREMPVHQRYSILMQIAGKIRENRMDFATLLSKESVKPMKYATGEIDRAVQTFTAAAEEAKRLPGEFLRLDWSERAENREGWVKYYPIGLIAGISPFNFPLNLAVHKIAPAIAAGCPIILKPSSSTPLSTLKLCKIIDETSIPKGAVSVIPMDRETGNRLVTDERVKLLSFTGSPAVGWKMKKEAGKKKVVLELGGNAGVIVSDSANLTHAVKRCIVGGFAYSGQVCIHAQRIYAQKKIFDAFKEAFIGEVKKLKVGDPLDPETDISGMIDEDNAVRVVDWINDAKEDGAKVLTGGKRNGTTVEPTVLTNTRQDMKVCALEIFGPVVALEPYEEFNHAVDAVNDSRFGLQAGVFTNRVDEMDEAFNGLDVGGVILNDVPTFRVDHMPYGGIKDSGLGREGLKYAIREMMEPKILVKNF